MIEQDNFKNNDANDVFERQKQAFLQLSKAVDRHKLRLEGKAPFLFGTTLGCWSVPIPTLQAASYLIAFVFFAKEIKLPWRGDGSFTTKLKTIKKQINASPVGAREKDLLWECWLLSQRLTTWGKIISETPMFVLSWLLFCASFFICFLRLMLEFLFYYPELL
jgi:hypothetical protein